MADSRLVRLAHGWSGWRMAGPAGAWLVRLAHGWSGWGTAGPTVHPLAGRPGLCFGSAVQAVLTEIALEPLRLLSSPEARTWWPAWLLAAMVAAVLELRSGGAAPAGGDGPGRMRRILLLQGLTHPSSRVDLQLLLVRAMVRVVLIGGFPLAAEGIAVRTVTTAYGLVGEPPLALAGMPLVLTYGAALFVASDLSRYGLHRAMHAVPWLWRFHQVHHSAEVLTPLTLYRIHPVEQLLQAARGGLVTGLVAGSFAWLSYGTASAWTLYGVPGVMFIFSVAGANLRHSGVWLPYPAALERVLISPAQHQLHHSLEPHAQRSNYGTVLALWDGLAGHLTLSTQGRPAAHGLRPGERNHAPDSLRSALLGPFGL